jgi:hypothetical protein
MENQTQDTNQATMTPDVGGEIPASTAPQLGINDLKNLLACVDMASRRGAYPANEMSAVGAIYDRVNAFLTSLTAANAHAADSADAATDATQADAAPQDTPAA